MRLQLRACAVLVAAVAVAGAAWAQPAASARPIKSVLAIHGGPEAFPGSAQFDATIAEVLYSHPTIEVDYYAEYLENEEFGALADTSLGDYIRMKYRDRPPDVVIVNTAPAVQFALDHRAELFPGVPIVFVATTPPAEVLRGDIPGVTGVVRDPSHTETLELALKLHPGTRRVHVVAYAPAVDGYQERIRAALTGVSPNVTLTFANEPTLAEAAAAIRTLPSDSLLFFTRYSPLSGRVILPDEAIAQIVQASPVPIYNNSEVNIGRGVVGGMMRLEHQTAIRLGEITLRILDGARIEDIPIEAETMAPIFDWRQVQRWHIDPSLLPPGADIRFRAPTAWDQYGPYIMATAVVVIAQLVLIAVLLGQHARLRSADNTIRASEASLRTSYDRIRQMAGRLINAQEVARADIARDLHDDVAQKLAYVSMGVNSLKEEGHIQDPDTQKAIGELEREARTAFDGIRRLSHELHPATLRLLGIAPALRSHCDEVAKRQGIEVQFSAGDNIAPVHPDVSVCFFRIAQESMRNSIVHGGAKHLTVTLTRAGDQLELIVADDGRGFDVSAVQRNGGGLGLVTMEERANLIGGGVYVDSEVGRGTTVHVHGPASPPGTATP